MTLPMTTAQQLWQRYAAMLEDRSIDIGEAGLRVMEAEIRSALRVLDAPDRGRLYLLISFVYQRQGKLREELDACLNALHADRTNPTFANAVGRAYGAREQHRNALKYLDRAARNLSNAQDPALRVTVALNQASAHLALGETAEGGEALDRAIAQLSPDHAASNLHVAIFLSVFGGPDVALEYTARYVAARLGMPRGESPAVEVLRAAPDDVLARPRLTPPLARMIDVALGLAPEVEGPDERAPTTEAATEPEAGSPLPAVDLPPAPTEEELARAIAESRDDDGSVDPYALAHALAVPRLGLPSDGRSFRFANDSAMMQLALDDA